MADEQRLRACYDMFVSGQPDDDPNVPPASFPMVRGWWAYSWAGEPQQAWLATSDSGVPLGCYVLELPERENRSNGFLMPLVAPASRRQGIGLALVAHAAGQADRAGRALLMADSRVGAPGAAFAAAIGARPGMQNARSVLDVGPDLHARLPGLRADAEAHAAGYSLRRWVGLTPGDLVSETCVLYTTLGDAPHDEAYQPATWDSDRLRAAEKRMTVQGHTEYSIAAIHDGSGEMAALTQVAVDPAGAEGWAYQEITAVIREHRGHRLGMLLKVAMLEWLGTAEPQLRQIVTFNAVPNEHMIAVNESLGHRVSDHFQGFELPVEAALKLAASV